jgi:outer membrane protein assembly factor BamD
MTTFALVLPTAFLGCRHAAPVDITSLSMASDKALWEAGQNALKKKQWESARQYLNRIIDGFPRSEYHPLARLALADSYFNEGGSANLVLAATQYREFQKLFPSHVRADYAQFQVAECYFKQRHRPDRDQINTQNAIEEFQRLLDLYTASSLLGDARTKIRTCNNELARAEYLVGLFYERTRRSCYSAVTRYEYLLDKYPDYPNTDEVLLRLSRCMIETGRQAEARPPLSRLIEAFPKSRYAAEARRLLNQLPALLPQPPQATPSPVTKSAAPDVSS